MLQIKVKKMQERLFQKSFLTFVVVKYKQEQFHCSRTSFILFFLIKTFLKPIKPGGESLLVDK